MENPQLELADRFIGETAVNLFIIIIEYKIGY